MIPVYFVTDQRPLSYNAKRKTKYQERLQKKFYEYKFEHNNLPLNVPVYSKIIYIHNHNREVRQTQEGKN